MTLSAVDFDWVCDLVRRESAIVLDAGKEYLAESRLHSIARAQGMSSVGALVRELRSGRLDGLRRDVVDAMTTNETSFFRDVHPWETLRTEVIPALIEERAPARSLSIWCAACSSGQEPYSLALLLREHFASTLAGWTVRILGTDLSESMLARARAGRYSQLEVNRGLPAPMLVKWFARSGTEWQLDESVRSMVEFRSANLADSRSWGAVPPADLVLIRNVLIYFDVATKRQILDAVHGKLRGQGVLFLGSSETTIGLVDCFDRVSSGKTIYYRRR